jgi:hypothetical protein
MRSPQQLRNLAWNCQALANCMKSERLQRSLMEMSRNFNRQACRRELHDRAP